jgi:hypothetical protein
MSEKGAAGFPEKAGIPPPLKRRADHLFWNLSHLSHQRFRGGNADSAVTE